MDHVGILRRAFHITRRHRVLWLFGALLALFNSSGGSGDSGPNISLPGGRGGPAPGWVPQWLRPETFDLGSALGIVIVCCFVLLLLVVASIIITYVARTALYRMVDIIEDTDESPSWRQGFRLGWSRRALRLFGIDLAMDIPFVLAVLLVLALALSPLLLLTAREDTLTVLGIVMTIGLGLLAVFAIIVAGVVFAVVKQFIHRQAALDGRSIGESIVHGYRMVRANLRDATIMWLLMFGVGLAWGIVMIPVFLLVVALAGGIGALPAYLIWKSTDLVWVALLVGIPLFLLVMGPPLVFLNSVYIVFKSSVWTLTFRELRARGNVPWVQATEADEGEPETDMLEL